jgi:hypothetical protein
MPAPFTGTSGVGFAFCAGAEAPAGVAGIWVAVLVAFAYERAGSCAGTAPGSGVVVPEGEAVGGTLDCC